MEGRQQNTKKCATCRIERPLDYYVHIQVGKKTFTGRVCRVCRGTAIGAATHAFEDEKGGQFHSGVDFHVRKRMFEDFKKEQQKRFRERRDEVKRNKITDDKKTEEREKEAKDHVIEDHAHTTYKAQETKGTKKAKGTSFLSGAVNRWRDKGTKTFSKFHQAPKESSAKETPRNPIQHDPSQESIAHGLFQRRDEKRKTPERPREHSQEELQKHAHPPEQHERTDKLSGYGQKSTEIRNIMVRRATGVTASFASTFTQKQPPKSDTSENTKNDKGTPKDPTPPGGFGRGK